MFKLELERVAKEIIERDAKKVLVQIPDGVKMKAHRIVDELEQKTDAQVFVWFSSCFGQCDYPLGLGPMGIDLMVQFGHNRFNKEDW